MWVREKLYIFLYNVFCIYIELSRKLFTLPVNGVVAFLSFRDHCVINNHLLCECGRESLIAVNIKRGPSVVKQHFKI